MKYKSVRVERGLKSEFSGDYNWRSHETITEAKAVAKSYNGRGRDRDTIVWGEVWTDEDESEPRLIYSGLEDATL
jgi:hypothetical protein